MLESATPMQALLGYLRDQRGVDFSGYKPTSLERRVRHAMAKTGSSTLDVYLDHLQANPRSLDDLFNALLINVTSFFRDKETWDELRARVVPELLKRGTDRPMRIWSASCASGEEAYSLAMLLADQVGVAELRSRVKIYATDIDPVALDTARAAIYRPQALEQLSADQREHYFEPGTDGGLAVRQELRRAVIFGRNDIVQDAPISRIDLLLCRNTLMYFTAETQAKVLERLHFALAPSGILMLGNAETPISHQGLFALFDRRRRFFRKVELDPGDRRRIMEVPTGSSSDRSSELARLRGQALYAGPLAQLVVSRSGRLTLVNQHATELLSIGDGDLGKLIQDLEISVRPVELRSLLLQVRSELREITVPGVRWTRPDGVTLVLDVELAPLLDGDGSLLGTAVSYSDQTRRDELESELVQVRQRLQAAFEELQSTTEELETTNEELQSTVEELETTNEELQSTNEELETMNEELQAVNDELYARGLDEHYRTNQAKDTNRVLDTVLDSVGIGVIGVDRNLTVTLWSHTSEELWGVRPEEAIGRPLGSIDMGLDPGRLVDRVRALMTLPGTQDGAGNAARVEAGAATKAATGGGSDNGQVVAEWVEAVNRRGRPLTVRLTGRAVMIDGEVAQVILIVESRVAQSSDVSR
jgi:two-component system CheB/CheR fusion protein